MPDQRTTDEDGLQWMLDEFVQSLWQVHQEFCVSGYGPGHSCNADEARAHQVVASLRARLAAAEAEVRWVRRLASVRGEVLASALAGVGSTPNPSDETSTSEERRLRYYLTNLRDGLTGGCLVDREWLVRYLDEVLNPVAGEGSDQDADEPPIEWFVRDGHYDDGSPFHYCEARGPEQAHCVLPTRHSHPEHQWAWRTIVQRTRAESVRGSHDVPARCERPGGCVCQPFHPGNCRWLRPGPGIADSQEQR